MLEMPFIVVFTVSSSVQSISPSCKGYQTQNSPYSSISVSVMHAVDGDALAGAAWTSHNVFLYD